jgi:hypothetical protein
MIVNLHFINVDENDFQVNVGAIRRSLCSGFFLGKLTLISTLFCGMMNLARISASDKDQRTYLERLPHGN